EKFDGFTPTFEHPSLTAEEPRFLLGAAYNPFYVRPPWLGGWTGGAARAWRVVWAALCGGACAPGGAAHGRARGAAPRAGGTVDHAEGRHMLTAICRYGPRTIPETDAIVAHCRRRGTLIQGPDISRFERAMADRLGVRDVITTSYGRMAFYYILKAFGFPAGAEVIVPALTFWVIPEMVRVAGLTPVPADVDPRTFNLDARAFERAITSRTVAVVPTHLYGLPCDMDA